jgi:hypothetical protein
MAPPHDLQIDEPLTAVVAESRRLMESRELAV